MGGIYLISCSVNKKVYVGSAKCLNTRWCEHVSLLNKEKHFNRNLQHAWKKYGAEAFSYSIHEVLGQYNRKLFFERENYWIEHLRTEGIALFNIARAEGGWGPQTLLRKDEIAKKISSSLKKTMSLLSEEERKQIYGGSKRNKQLSDIHRQRVSNSLIGISKSNETKRRMSEAQRNMVDVSRRNRMREIGRGRKGKTPATAIVYQVDGQIFPSGAAAMRTLGITARQLAKKEKDGTATRKEKEEIEF